MIRSTVALRDRDLLDVFDLAVRFAARHGRKLAIVCAVSFLPGFAICVLAREALEPIALWPLALLFVVLGEVPLVALASRLVFDESATAKDGLAIGLNALPRILGVRILQTLAIGVSSIAILAPLWVHGILLFAPEVALLERASPMQACMRSQRLASRSTGESVLGAALLMAAQVLAAPIGDYVGRATIGQLFDATPPPPIWDDPSSVVALFGFFAAAPLLALLRFFLYLNVRTRVEGWDVQTRFVAIAQRQAAEEA